MTHPCQRCGACCATFRVAFHWSEAQPASPDGVAAALVLPLRHHELELRRADGTDRCVALAGRIGESTACTIYPARPSPCRALAAAWEAGAPSPQCDRARARHGLSPLGPADWGVSPAG